MAILKPGSMWAGHLIVRLLGAGGFAEVYEVRDRAGVRRVLKVMSTEEGLASKLQARLAQEGEALALVEHINVLRFYDAGVEDDRVWLLLEFVEGTNLREIEEACGGRPPMESVLRWARQACEGLAAAHAQGVVHRDVKPENILVTPADVVKVIDFGLAKLMGWGLKTTQQHLAGTAFYMAPEHLRSSPADPRMDVYAMGLVLYEALAGIHPVAQLGGPLTILSVCGRQLTYMPPPLATFLPEVPGDLSDLVQRAIAKDPAQRIATMAEFAARLQEILARLLVHRRSAARNLPLPGREAGLQRTVPMPVQQDRTARGPSGTVKLEVVALPSASPPSAAVPEVLPARPTASVAPDVRVTGDRAALAPPRPQGERRRRWRLVVAIALFIAISVGLAWLGLSTLGERRSLVPALQR